MQIPKPLLGLLGALALTASCSTTSTDDTGSGGASAAGGAATSGGTTASGGTSTSGGSPATGGVATGGSTTDLGGNAGSAGAPALPGCGCTEESSITIEFPEGPHVYDRIAEHIDNCNPLTCEPESAYAIKSGAPPNRYMARACDAEGECITVRTGTLSDDSNIGSVTIESDGEVTFDEQAIVEGGRVLDAAPSFWFAFETGSEEPLQGTGEVCWAKTDYVCLK